MDVRPLQEPDRAPLTATYLDGLLSAYEAAPLVGESFAFLMRSDLDDPSEAYDGLAVVGRRQLPPTRLLRSAALTIDPFLLRGATIGSAWRADRTGAAGAVYHTVGVGPLPIASDLPTVATLLDLAPWELPDQYARSTAARFGQRLRGRLLREAPAVIVASPSVARLTRRLLRIKTERIRVVPLAPRDVFVPLPDGATDGATDLERERLGLSGRYLVYSGRYDARQDLPTLLAALVKLAEAGRPAGLARKHVWPPRILLVGASPDDRASLARAASRQGIGESLAYAQGLPPAGVAGLVRAARAAILPVVSEASGLPAIEAIACGTPVVASAVGALPDVVGGAGILVEPRDPERLAIALRAVWTDGAVATRLAERAREAATGPRRTWADVARETRTIYAEVGIRPAHKDPS
jgi:glycosyltransferase involved in cell wall biosynthesis